MTIASTVATVRRLLGKLTDLLLVGRNAGWWRRKPGPGDRDGL